MCRVGVEEAAAVGAQHLDRDLRGHRAHRQRLLVGALVLHHRLALVVLHRLAVGAQLGLLVLDDLERLHVLVGVEVLHHALLHEEQRVDEADRQQDPQHDAGQVDPGVADALGRVARKAADQRDDHHDAGGGREEVLHRQAQHLGQVAHRLLAAVALPVGVGDEAERGVERRVGRHVGHCLRVQRQPHLQTLQRVDREHAQAVEQQDGQRVLQPAHVGVGLDAAQAIQAGLRCGWRSRAAPPSRG